MNCPNCNYPGAYVGLTVVECASIHCKHFKPPTITVTNEWKTPLLVGDVDGEVIAIGGYRKPRYTDDVVDVTISPPNFPWPLPIKIIRTQTTISDEVVERIKKEFAAAIGKQAASYFVSTAKGEDLDRLAGIIDTPAPPKTALVLAAQFRNAQSWARANKATYPHWVHVRRMIGVWGWDPAKCVVIKADEPLFTSYERKLIALMRERGFTV